MNDGLREEAALADQPDDLLGLARIHDRNGDGVIDAAGRAAVEAILVMSAERVAGLPQEGKRGPREEVSQYGSRPGWIA